MNDKEKLEKIQEYIKDNYATFVGKAEIEAILNETDRGLPGVGRMIWYKTDESEYVGFVHLETDIEWLHTGEEKEKDDYYSKGCVLWEDIIEWHYLAPVKEYKYTEEELCEMFWRGLDYAKKVIKAAREVKE